MNTDKHGNPAYKGARHNAHKSTPAGNARLNTKQDSSANSVLAATRSASATKPRR